MSLAIGVALWLSLLAPLAVVVATTQTRTAGEALRWGQVAGLVTAACWFVVTLGGEVQAGPVTAQGAVGPVGVVTALLVVALEHPVARRAIAARHAAMASIMFGLALAAGAGAPGDAFSGLAAGAALLVVGHWGSGQHDDSALAPAVIGTAMVIVGVAGDFLSSAQAGWVVVGGAVLVVVAATTATRTAAGLLLPAVLALTISRTAMLGNSGDLPALLVALLAMSAAWHGSTSRREGASTNVALVLGLWSVAILAAGDSSGAWLLAAPATLVTVVASPVTMAAATPGVLVLVTRLANGLVLDRTAMRLGFGLLLALGVAGVLIGTVRRSAPRGLGVWGAWAGIGAGGWLLVAPATWGWTTAGALIQPAVSPLDSWAYGAGPVVAAGALIGAGSLVVGRSDFHHLWHLVRAGIEPDMERPLPAARFRIGRPALVVAAVVLLLSVAVLVGSFDRVL